MENERKSIQFSLQLLSARVFICSLAALPRHFAGSVEQGGRAMAGGGRLYAILSVPPRHATPRLVCSTRSRYKRQPCAHISFFNKHFSFHWQRVRASLAAKELLKWQICTVMQGSSSREGRGSWQGGSRGRGRRGSVAARQVSSSLLGAPN